MNTATDNDSDSDEPVVIKTVRVNRNDREGRQALKNVLRWHGPDDIHTEVMGKRVAHPGTRALVSLRTHDTVRPDQLANASVYLDLLADWCHDAAADALDQIAEFQPHLDAAEAGVLVRAGTMTEVIVESRLNCLRDIEEARAVLARLRKAIES